MEIRNTSAVSETQLSTDSRLTAVSSSEPSATSSNSKAAEPAAKVTQHTVLSRWVVLASVTKSMGQSEHSVRSLQQLSRQLKSLEMQVRQNGNSPQTATKVNTVVDAIKRQLTQGNVDNHLQPSTNSSDTVTRELSNKVDFLTPKALDEQVNIVMGRTGKAVSLSLSAGADKQQNLQTVQQAFASQQIDVSVSERQTLLFSASGDAASALKQSWQMMGTGVRVAAGNPVTIALGEPPHALDGLQQLAQQGDTRSEAYQQELSKLQRDIKSALQSIDSRRQQILQRLQQIQTASGSTDELAEIDAQVQQILQQPDKYAVSILISQANITRNLVSFSLSATAQS